MAKFFNLFPFVIQPKHSLGIFISTYKTNGIAMTVLCDDDRSSAHKMVFKLMPVYYKSRKMNSAMHDDFEFGVKKRLNLFCARRISVVGILPPLQCKQIFARKYNRNGDSYTFFYGWQIVLCE